VQAQIREGVKMTIQDEHRQDTAIQNEKDLIRVSNERDELRKVIEAAKVCFADGKESTVDYHLLQAMNDLHTAYTEVQDLISIGILEDNNEPVTDLVGSILHASDELQQLAEHLKIEGGEHGEHPENCVACTT
jgi:hypothetical protein